MFERLLLRGKAQVVGIYETVGGHWKGLVVGVHDRPRVTPRYFKGALYRIWCGVNKLGDSGVKVV